MVHALREAHRVLRPDGLAIDLRPAAKHRRVGLGTGSRWKLVGVMREPFDEDWAADSAVARVVRDGLYRLQSRAEFPLDRVMDGMDDFRQWLREFGQRRTIAAHDWLVRRLERALAARPRPMKIVARGPMALRVLARAE